jgi:hypothetical protein
MYFSKIIFIRFAIICGLENLYICFLLLVAPKKEIDSGLIYLSRNRHWSYTRAARGSGLILEEEWTLVLDKSMKVKGKNVSGQNVSGQNVSVDETYWRQNGSAT